jgi:tryptophanyl-tRNA synthetase
MSASHSSPRKQVLSGIQPTGNLHLGRYFGAISNWVELQKDYDCVFGVVDYHAMTMPYDPANLRNQVWNLAFDLMAVGVEPENMFIQSLIPEHTELAWIFNCMSSFGEVTRMTQFKDKSQQISDKDKDAFISAGLFTYPILQAADILIYKADYVPVGKDQEQHLELTRNVAQRFNNFVGREYFTLPDVLYTEIPKVLSTADPTIKMSASKGAKHHINVFSEPEVIRKQIKSAVTDSGDTPAGEISPGVANLLAILRAAGGADAANHLAEEAKAGTLQYGRLKEVVADQLLAMTNPFREKRREMENNSKLYMDRVVASSAEIRKKAQATVRDVKSLVGLMV